MEMPEITVRVDDAISHAVQNMFMSKGSTQIWCRSPMTAEMFEEALREHLRLEGERRCREVADECLYVLSETSSSTFMPTLSPDVVARTRHRVENGMRC